MIFRYRHLRLEIIRRNPTAIDFNYTVTNESNMTNVQGFLMAGSLDEWVRQIENHIRAMNFNILNQNLYLGEINGYRFYTTTILGHEPTNYSIDIS